MYRTAFAAGFAFALGMGGVTSANAGLLDLIFGWRDRTAAPRATAPAPHPVVTISAKPKNKVARAKNRTPKAPAQLSPQEMLARTIDPNKNPNWHLEDPTLRKGDILVLNDRVVVFTGGPLGAPKSYVALSRTKLLTKQERLQVAAMTRRPAEPEAFASGEPRQPRLLRSVGLGGPVLPPLLGQGQEPRS